MAVDFDGLVIGPTIAAFGDPVLYTPQSTGIQITLATGGVFDEAFKEITFDTGVPLATQHPVVGVRDSDFATPPQQGDLCTIRGQNYKVSDVQSDSHGWTKLVLGLIRGAS